MPDINSIGIEAAFHFVLIFLRIGAAVMLISGFGETYIPPRVRLFIAGSMSLLLLPVLEDSLPAPDLSLAGFFGIIIPEIVIGIMIGAVTRILQGVLHVAGMIIAFQSSLASAVLFDANQGSQGSVFGTFMTIMGLTLIFVTDLHHIILMALVESYQVVPVAGALPVGDMAQMAMRTLSDGFRVALMLAAPTVVVGTLLYLAAGLLGRLMPNMQVFFVMIPAQVLMSFVLLSFVLSSMMMWYINHYEHVMTVFMVDG